MGSDGVGKNAAYGGEPIVRSRYVDGTLSKAGRYEVVELRWNEHEGGDKRSVGDAETADVLNSSRAIMQWSGRNRVVPAKIAI